jgi:trans-aconitate methyltransferase
MAAPDICGRDNPWLAIPATDYEGHMALPEVGQLQVLSALFGDTYRELQPARLAVLGCATGNGFEHIDPLITPQAVGVDINPQYLEIARARYAQRLPGLQLLTADLATCKLAASTFELISAALVFEYLRPLPLLRRISDWLAPAGTLAAVLQLPGDGCAPVTPTKFRSLERLEPVMRLVDPDEFLAAAAAAGLAVYREREVPLPGGKRLFAAMLRPTPH